MIKDFFRLIYSLLALIVVLIVFIGVIVSMLARPDWFRSKAMSSAPAVQGTVPVTEAPVKEAGWLPKSLQTDLPAGPEGELVAYGHQLISETSQLLGKEALKGRALVGNGLTCKNCHIASGTQPFAAPYVGVVNRFPTFRGREGREASLEDRINGCMERSMNGKALADDSKEMKAMLAYMQWLGEGVPPETAGKFQGFVALEVPGRKVDMVKGKQLYTEKCQLCHGNEGKGQQAPGGKTYLYPPLWGPNSYNHGAGMNRVITAARFIKGNMPFGATYETAQLTDEEAYDVAGYINSHTRPVKPGVEKDYPDLTKKPIDSPYGPYADPFPQEQHQFGPFQPIKAYYDSLKASGAQARRN